ncbi:MAG TPA: hypothetical protein VM755_15245 [Stellaceae bacterium]|nr:hypothetical protein [Stellaceae bacterium]
MAKAYAVAAHAFFGDYRPNWREASAFALGSVGIGVFARHLKLQGGLKSALQIETPTLSRSNRRR